MDKTSFGKSFIGVVLVGVIFFIKDVLILIIEIVVNVLSLFALRAYLDKKKSIGATKPENQSSDLSGSSNETKDVTIGRMDSKNKHNKINKNLTYMVLVICAFSAIGHVSTILCAGAFMVSQDMTSYGVCFSFSLFISFKHFFNIFIFLLFNNLFLKEFKSFIGFA
jgi:hypothetical protein